jgi:hypothetical protein
MAKELRERLYTAFMLAAAALAVAGVVLLWSAVSFEGYIGALLVLAVAAVCVVAGRELKASGAEADRAASPG